jgi:HEPN domain-containing protein
MGRCARRSCSVRRSPGVFGAAAAEASERTAGRRPESVSEWLEVGERELRLCRLLYEKDLGYSPEICWYSHQTCEKHMKALLVAQRVRPERTHDLKTLLAALRAAGLGLPGLDTDCELLNKHAITPRYPAGLNLGLDDANAAFTAAERVVRALRAELPPRLH